MGEPNGLAVTFQNARRLPRGEPGTRDLGAQRRYEQRDGRRGQRCGDERNLLRVALERGDPHAHKSVERPGHIEGLWRVPRTTPKEVPPELERVERRPPGDGVEPRKNRPAEAQVEPV